jgi:ribosomal protein S18 acetylase RimI-like enzyme
VLQLVFRRASLGNVGDREALLAHPQALQLSEDLVTRGRTRVATLPDDTVIGFASTTPSDPGSLELDDLFVDPDWQRRGVARLLVTNLISEAAGEGVTRLAVTANDHAMAFYRNAGFTIDGLVETQFGVGTRMHLDVAGAVRP